MDEYTVLPAFKYWYSWLAKNVDVQKIPEYFRKILCVKLIESQIISVNQLQRHVGRDANYLRAILNIKDEDLEQDILDVLRRPCSNNIIENSLVQYTTAEIDCYDYL